MTQKEKSKDLKAFQELVKSEMIKLGNYDATINSIVPYEMRNILTALETAIHNVNFSATYYNEDVIELCGKMAAQALILSSNAQRALDAWESRLA